LYNNVKGDGEGHLWHFKFLQFKNGKEGRTNQKTRKAGVNGTQKQENTKATVL